MQPNFWAEFETVTAEQWRKAVEQSLKGKPFDTLCWQVSNETTPVQPYYWQNSVQHFPTARTNNNWHIVERVVVGKDKEQARQKALNALQNGANAIYWDLTVPINKWEEISQLCDGIHLPMIQTHWTGKATESYSFLQFLYLVAGDIAGSLQVPAQDDDSYLWAIESMPQMRLWTITIDSKRPADEQLAYILQQCDNLLWYWLNRGRDIEEIAPRIQVLFHTTDSYLLEIAKLRAFRRLWTSWLAAYGEQHAAITPHVFCQTTLTQTDKNSNIIAATAQAMAAVVGHTDSLEVTATENNDFGSRIARNVQHLLALECHLDKVVDPAAGSFYLENLTDILSQAAWKQFQSVSLIGV